MHLQKIELIGFKSFGEKTTITLPVGITAIVGPNGCGKSNIADALLWVIGEQSTKALRGERMEDFIFNGTENRRPLGMAEVTITFTGVDKQISPLPQEQRSEFSQYREIQVTRRLFRSGESEYLINKMPCRLKDVRDLMFDLGIGTRIHTIIEQGKVDQVLSSKPTDRRVIIEEVAGIMKYKMRKNEALNKLEATNQNLLRVKDIISEVRRQMNSLERQARKAQEFRKLQEEIKERELQLMSREYAGLNEKWAYVEKERQGIEEEERNLSTRVSVQEAELEDIRLSLLDKEREWEAGQREFSEIEGQILKLEGKIEIQKNQISTYSEQEVRTIEEISEKKEAHKNLDRQKLTLKDEFEKNLSVIDRDRSLLQQKGSLLADINNQFILTQQALEEERKGLFDHMVTITTLRNQISNLQSYLQEVERRADRDEGEISQVEKEAKGVKFRHFEQEEKLTQIKRLLEEKKREAEGIEEDIKKAQGVIKDLEEKLAGTKEDLNLKEAQLLSLKELERNYAEYQDGVRSVLLNKDKDPQEIEGICGVVADVLEAVPQYETAIEAALGEALQYVIVEDHHKSCKAVTYLKTKNAGRCTFVPLEVKGNGNTNGDYNGPEKVIGPALTLVNYDRRYSNVIEHLLGGVLVVEDLATAVELWRKRENAATFVTLDGEVIDPWGKVSYGNNNGKGGLLHKKRTIKELEGEVSILQKEAENLEANRRLKLEELGSTTSSLNSIEEEIHRYEIEFVNEEGNQRLILEEERRIDQRLKVLIMEREERGKEKERLVQELRNADTELMRLTGLGKDREEKKNLLQESLSRLQVQLDSLRDEVTQIKVDLSSNEEKSEGLRRKRGEIDESMAILSHQISKKEKELKELAADKMEADKILAESTEGLHLLSRSMVELKKVLTEKEEALSIERERLRTLEEALRTDQRAMEGLLKRKNEVDIKRVELRLQMEHLRSAVAETYKVDLEEIAERQESSSIDYEEIKKELADIKERIDNLVPVNMAAMEEFNELQERYEFLTKQHDDLTQSINSLHQAIAKINRTTKEMFLATFQQVKEKFSSVFTSFFEGGRAELILMDEGDILESGIEIVAQPPGKRLENISLLSGGEKALTAIALLFACFLIRPNPFCVLDEIDAPLDDANIGRFTRALKQMSERTQFIVVTHNKRTMEAADNLYGITMEEPGVSKLISVSLREPALL